MRNLIVFTAILALALLGSAGVANADTVTIWPTDTAGQPQFSAGGREYDSSLRVEAQNTDNTADIGMFQGGYWEGGGARYFGAYMTLDPSTIKGEFGPADSTTANWRFVTRTANSDNTRMTILNANGNVGIGIENPEAKLDVNGDILATDDADTLAVIDDTVVSVVDLSRRIAVLEAIVMDLPPGLLNQKDRNADNK